MSSEAADQARKAANEQQRLQRQMDAWRYRTVQGWTQQRIADALRVSQSTISRDLTACHKQFLEEHKDQVVQVKIQQSLLLDTVIEEALEEWRASKQEQKSVTRRSYEPDLDKKDHESEDVNPLPTSYSVVTTNVRTNLGNVRYLHLALQALGDQRKIWGADSPVSFDLTTAGHALGLRDVLAHIPQGGEETPEDRQARVRGEAG